jgi:predicted nucleic acid-binding protein
MLYLDTCVLLAVLLPEVHSSAAAAFLEEARGPLAISSWSVTELHSALGLKVRTKALSQAQAETVQQGFERSLAPGLLVLELEPQDFRNANACLRGWSTSLRAADALHLAIASGRDAALCSLDPAFVAAAQQLGLEAQLLRSGEGHGSPAVPPRAWMNPDQVQCPGRWG